jgi:hypothetical protein
MAERVRMRDKKARGILMVMNGCGRVYSPIGF